MIAKGNSYNNHNSTIWAITDTWCIFTIWTIPYAWYGICSAYALRALTSDRYILRSRWPWGHLIYVARHKLCWTSDGCVLRFRWPPGHRRYVDTWSFWYVHWSVCTSSVRLPRQPSTLFLSKNWVKHHPHSR